MKVFKEELYRKRSGGETLSFERYKDDNGEEFICMECNSALNVQSKTVKPRNIFLKSCQEVPEYVCTCCHRHLFKKGVSVFNVEKYDFGMEEVSETLSDRFSYKSSDKDCEYICATCNFHLKLGDMPAQAVANQLELPDIPEILKTLTCLELCCIALRIPFMAIWAMRKGGLGKITGPCVNVPASLEPITEVVPRVPEDTQLVIAKLK